MPKEHFSKLLDQRRQAILQSGIIEFSQKSYGDASTDAITKGCGISKGLLFHYFGSKQALYYCCLEESVAALSTMPIEYNGQDFYELIFAMAENKIHLSQEHPGEAHFIQMASKETSNEVKDRKNAILTRYMAKMRTDSAQLMAQASAGFPFKKSGDPIKLTASLMIFSNALISIYLDRYQDRPDAFFRNAVKIKVELKEYIDFMLYGIAETK